MDLGKDWGQGEANQAILNCLGKMIKMHLIKKKFLLHSFPDFMPPLIFILILFESCNEINDSCLVGCQSNPFEWGKRIKAAYEL